MNGYPSDDVIDRLARLFLEHPTWIDASRYISADATITVFFSHRPGKAWHLENQAGKILLLPGVAEDPDFVFRFTPAAIERLESVGEGMDDFAVELFHLMLEESKDEGVAFRVVAGFPRLLRRGYVRLLLSAGPRVIAFGEALGILNLNDLRKLVSSSCSREPMTWEKSGDDR